MLVVGSQSSARAAASVVVKGRLAIRALASSANAPISGTTSTDGELAGSNTLSHLSNDGILTVTMNRPQKLNAWTEPMMLELENHFERAAADSNVAVMILTGAGKYYCAGVNLSGLLKPMHPGKLHELIRSKNQRLFDIFLNMPKPVIAAVNGPAIGASVTSAALCDAIVASESATFSTPFSSLGLPPEGCSSVHFGRIFGEGNAHRMMGPEGWVPTAKEALELGLVHSVVEDSGQEDEDVQEKEKVSGTKSALLDASCQLAQEWIRTGKPREIGPLRGGPDAREEYRRVNARESVELADCVLGTDFLEGQRAFLSSRGKTGPALAFSILKMTRPLWGMMVPKPQKSTHSRRSG